MSINDLVEEAGKLYDCYVLIGKPIEQKDPTNVQTQCNVACRASDLTILTASILSTLEKILEDAFKQARLCEQEDGEESQETMLRNLLTPHLLNGCSTLISKYTNTRQIVDGIIQNSLEDEVSSKNSQSVTLH